MAIKEIFESNTDKIDLATELLSELSDREGKYVWKKYSGATFKVSVSTDNGFTITSAIGFDKTQVDANFFEGFSGVTFTAYGHEYEVSFIAGTKIKIYDKTANSTSQHNVTYNASTGQISLSDLNGMTAWSLTNSSFSKDFEFVDYVVSDDTEAYPDGGEQDGYWYELYNGGGVSGVDYGDIVLSSVTKTLTIPHSLDAIPRYFMLIPAGVINTEISYGTCLIASNNAPFITGVNGATIHGIRVSTYQATSASGGVLTTQPNTFSASEVVLNDNTGYRNGSYKWAVFA